MEDVLHTPTAVADFLGTSTGNLAQMRYLGRGPAFVKLGAKAVRYRDSAILEWIEANTKTQT